MKSHYYVRLGSSHRILTLFSSDSTPWQRGLACVAETPEGPVWGEVLWPRKESFEESYPGRRAGAEDHERYKEYQASRLDLTRSLEEIIDELNLGITVLDLEGTLDGSYWKAFYSSSNGASLGAVTRRFEELHESELHWEQLGARARAQSCGGIAVCGREFCCSTVFRELTPVTMKMARAQGRSLFPEDTAGACGRLKCCLRYEYDESLYEEVLALGREVSSARMKGKIVAVREQGRIVVVENDEGQRRELFAREIVEAEGQA